MELYEKKGRGATGKKERVVTECAETGYRTRQFQYWMRTPGGLEWASPILCTCALLFDRVTPREQRWFRRRAKWWKKM